MKTPVCARIVVLQKLEMLWIELPTTCELSPAPSKKMPDADGTACVPSTELPSPKMSKPSMRTLAAFGSEREAVLVRVALTVDLGAQAVPGDEGHELT